MQQKNIVLLCAAVIVLLIVCLVPFGSSDGAPQDGSAAAAPVRIPSSEYTEERQIQVPCADKSCQGQDYHILAEWFRDAGFVNISAIAEDVSYDEVFFNGYVLFVTIDGESTFSGNARFDPSAVVEIHYVNAMVMPEDSASSVASDESGLSDGEPGDMVWLPQSGSKYHSRADCSGMIDPRKVSLEEAQRLGYSPCKRCH